MSPSEERAFQFSRECERLRAHVDGLLETVRELHETVRVLSETVRTRDIQLAAARNGYDALALAIREKYL
jgi:hypothetical protein